MTYSKVILFIACVLNCCLTATAQSFKSEKLRKAAQVVGISDQLAVLSAETTTAAKAADGQLLTVRTDATKTVEHIGVPLFSEEMRALMPSPVYDFLEYAALNWKYKVNPNTLYLSKVLFRKGNWDKLLKGRLQECSCSISNQDDRLYIVTWQRNETDEVVLGIPIEYELLANDSRRNVERDFIRHLASQKTVTAPATAVVTEDDLKIYGTGGLFVKEGDSYILKELNQNVYYELKTIYEKVDTVINHKPVTMTLEDVIPAVVRDSEHPVESFANLMMSDDRTLPDVRLSLDFHLSDYHRQQLAVPLSQLKDYLQQQGCSIYFACSAVTKEHLKGMLLAHNIREGYDHLFSLTLPVRQLTDKAPVAQAAVYLYIPPIDKSKLFGKTPTKKSGAKIYEK